MPAPDLHFVIDRVTGEVIVPLGVWEDPEAAAEEIAEQFPEEPGRYEVRTVIDADGLTDDTFALAEHMPSELLVSPIVTLVDGALLTPDFFDKVGSARCTFPVPGTEAPCGAPVLTEDDVTVSPTGDVVVPAGAWARWNADRCADHMG